LKKIGIIGGGAAGFFAAINIAQQGIKAEITILERSKEVLQKVKISGGGRCNITHACYDVELLTKNYPRGQKALRGPFNKFQPRDTIEWFARQGIKIVEEADGRMFPSTNDSQTVIDCFVRLCEKWKIEVLTQTRVTQITKLNSGWELDSSLGTFNFDILIVAGGSSEGLWGILEKQGLKIIPPVPSLFSCNIKDEILNGLAGISILNVLVNVEGRKHISSGPCIITHWGLSGPAFLKLSAWEARFFHEKQYKLRLEVNWLGVAKNRETFLQELVELKSENAKKKVLKDPKYGLPARLWAALVASVGIEENENWADLSKAKLAALAQVLCACKLEAQGKTTNKDEFVTCGGVDLGEIDFRTMEVKQHQNMYIIGEILDIDAVTGGFNFQAAWTEAWIVAQSIKEKVEEQKELEK